MAPQATPAAGSGQLSLPQPGQPWPDQQSLYSGIIATPTGTAWALTLPTDVPKLRDQAWGKYGTLIEGANDPFDGRANTVAMAAAGNKLAQAVLDLPGDCYLPSQMEALLLSVTLREQVGPGVIWTSTQRSAHNAWCQSFDYGNQGWDVKSNRWRAVPVRRSLLRSFDLSATNLLEVAQ